MALGKIEPSDNFEGKTTPSYSHNSDLQTSKTRLRALAERKEIRSISAKGCKYHSRGEKRKVDPLFWLFAQLVSNECGILSETSEIDGNQSSDEM